jgi:Winged helix-turn helix
MDARGDVWTASRVAVVIEQTFGVRYHRDHVGRLLREAGWSRQQPIERATQRNEEALKEWSEQRWPAIKKSRRGQGHDQRGAMKPGFIRLSMAVRTSAPRGQTPVLRVKLTRDHLICASAASLPMGDCSCKCVLPPNDAAAVVGFLRKISGKIVVIWDGSPIHRGHEIKDFRQQRSHQTPASGTTAGLCP